MRISTFCFWPTVRSWTLAWGGTMRLYFSEISATCRSASFWSMMSPFLGSMPRIMFSITVRDGTSMKCWCTMPMPIRMAAVGEAITVFSPLM